MTGSADLDAADFGGRSFPSPAAGRPKPRVGSAVAVVPNAGAGGALLVDFGGLLGGTAPTAAVHVFRAARGDHAGIAGWTHLASVGELDPAEPFARDVDVEVDAVRRSAMAQAPGVVDRFSQHV